MKTITGRLKILINGKTSAAKKFKELEDLTNIPSGTWRTWWNRDTKPSAEMIEAIAQIWPEHAFWLATGFEDGAYGHTAPGAHGYPSETTDQPNSAAYFNAIRKCRDEANKLARIWAELEPGEEASPFSEMPDHILRSILMLQLPDELKKEMKGYARQLDKAAKLRRAEILLNVEMPKIGYDETESLGETIKQLLDQIPKVIADEGRKSALENKLQHELDRLKRHREFTTEPKT